MAIGTAVAGPYGTVAGAVLGGIAGSVVNSVKGTDTDYDFSMGGSYKDNRSITTALGTIGFDAASTRNLTTSKQGAAMLGIVENVVGPLDNTIASMLSPSELANVRNDLSNFRIENSQEHSLQDNVQLMIKARLESVAKYMSPEAKQAYGFDKTITAWNQRFAPVSDQTKQQVSAAINKYTQTKNSLSRDDFMNDMDYQAALSSAAGDINNLMKSDSTGWIANAFSSYTDPESYGMSVGAAINGASSIYNDYAKQFII